ncbi:MAG: transglutaminase family protein [Rhodobacter sp.]|nr:transglutaminase family protein [Paracoccaceae bacterium]MCB1409570.1 transglutaminase family protein [Paracoccaceae bacterium]MCC0080720.1 transglutaminase family protein [Rhodobacter sp.]
MIYDIALAIDYGYAARSDRSRTLMRLLPPDLPGAQTVLSRRLHIDPAPDERRDWLDFFGNATTSAVWHTPLNALRISVDLGVERLAPPPLTDLSPALADLPAALAAVRDLGARSPHHFRRPSARVAQVDAIETFARALAGPRDTVIETVQSLGHALHAEMQFDAAATSVETGPAQAFAQRRGVCQDFAHVMIAGLRALGVPAGYVSGFLRTEPPPGQPRLEGADAMHAWVSAWTGPATGWMAFDPTNDQWAGLDYVVVAQGRDYLDVAPVLGSLRSAGGQVSRHSVDMIPRAD